MLEQRIASLEKQNRWLAAGVVGLSVALGLIVAGGAAGQADAAKKVRAGEFILVDAQGAEVGRLAAKDDGPTLILQGDGAAAVISAGKDQARASLIIDDRTKTMLAAGNECGLLVQQADCRAMLGILDGSTMMRCSSGKADLVAQAIDREGKLQIRRPGENSQALIGITDANGATAGLMGANGRIIWAQNEKR